MQPSSNDILRLRGPKQLSNPVLNAVPKVVVATALVNQSSFTYPLYQIEVDSVVGLADIKDGYLFSIGTSPGGDDVLYGVIRGLPDSDTFYVDAKDSGDPGYPQSIIQPVLDNYYITVYKFRPAWGLMSSIRGGVFYKKWDLQYTNQLFDPDPICRFGGWVQEFIDDSTGTAFVNFDNSSSHFWGSATKVSQLWDVDGGTIVVNTDTDEAITVEFEPGFYEVECAILDTKGKSHTGYRYVWINTNTPDEEWSPFSYRHVVRITSDAHEFTGRKQSYEVDGDVTDELFPGQGFFFKEYPKFLTTDGDWEELDNPEFFPFTYCGYRVDSNYKTSKNLSTTTITTEGPGWYANTVVSATQQIVEAQYPLNWAQCTATLSNPVGAAWYTCYWHAPYLINGHDFLFDEYLLTLRKRSFQFSSTQVGPQLQGLQDMMLGFIGWKSDGSLKMVRNPMFLTNSERNDLDTWWTWLPEDIQSNLEISRSFRMPTGQVYGSAFSFDGTDIQPYASLAPGYSKAQGTNSSTMTSFIIVPYRGQERSNELTGHQFAIENRKEPDFSMTLMKNMDLVDPINIDSWYVMNVPAEYDPEGYGWTTKRIMPLRISRSWSVEPHTVKSLQTEWQVESFGLSGITVPIDRGGGNNWWVNQWNPGNQDNYEPKSPDIGFVIDLVYAWNDSGLLGRSESFSETQVEWYSVTGYTGQMRDAAFDSASPYWSDPNDPLAAWFVTDDGADIYVYYVQDLFALSLDFNLEDTFTPGLGYDGKVRIAATDDGSDLAVVAWKDQTGVSFSRITSSSHTWSSPTHIGATVSDPDHDTDELGLDVKGETQVVIAPDGSVNVGDGKLDYFLYATDTASGTFAKVNNSPVGERAILGCVQLSTDQVAVVGYEGPGTSPPGTPLSIVTFDGSGYPDYDIGVFTVGPVGPFPPAIYNAINQFGSNAVSVTIELNAEYMFESMTMLADIEGDWGGSSYGPYSYQTSITFYKGYGTANQVTVASKVFLGESPFYDATQFKTDLKAQEMEATGLIDAVQITIAVQKPDLAPGIYYLYMDNIDIVATFVERESTRLTRSVQLVAETWSDITPSTPVAPKTPYGVGTSGNNYSLIGYDENEYSSLYASTTGGSAWSSKGKTRSIGVKRTDDLCVFFGFGSIGISEDNGSTVYSRLGDWVIKVGRIGSIRGMIGLL